jgi:hypothetical protein
MVVLADLTAYFKLELKLGTLWLTQVVMLGEGGLVTHN